MSFTPLGEILLLDREEVAVEFSGHYCTVGLRSFGRGLFIRPTVDGALSSYSSLYRLREGQVVFSRLFAWEGAVAVVPPEFDGWLVSPEFPTFTVDRERADLRYLAHVLCSERFREELRGATRGLGQRRQRVHVDDFLSLAVPLPSITEQGRIGRAVDEVHSVTGRVDNLSKRAALLSSAITVACSSRPDLSDQERLQRGWRPVKLDEIFDVSDRQTDVTLEGTYRVAGIYSFGKGLIDRGQIRGSETSYKTMTMLDEGDVVISKLNGWEGAIAVVSDRFAGYCVSPEYPVFKGDSASMPPGFFAAIARSAWFWEALNANARGSMVRRRRISGAEFLATQIWLPPLGVQGRVARMLDLMDKASERRAVMQARVDALVPAALNEAFASLS